MQLLWVDDSFPQKEKVNNYQLDSSRTADSSSYLYNPDESSQKEEKENLNFSSFNEKNNLKDEETRILLDNLKERKIKNNHDNVHFKKCLSIVLCIIYCILFLINNPKIPVRIGEEQNIETLIKNNTNKKINILINQLFFCNNETENNRGIKGFLLEFSINKIYLVRWLIGFSYFIVKCICFIYSNNGNNNNYLLDKTKVNIIQKISMLFFPLCLFYYDFKNNISYSEIKVEKINNKEISFFVMTKKNFSMIDYIEGLIPTLFYFLISIDYDIFLRNINIFNIKRNKMNKVV
jgi:hypothetical protein